MIECSCEWDGESYGAFDRYEESVREYRKCTECGATIWPWEQHVVGLWWDCEECDQPDDEDDPCYSPGEDSCCEGLPPTGTAYMCTPCARACDHLLCGMWWFGRNWEEIAERNEMSLAECVG